MLLLLTMLLAACSDDADDGVDRKDDGGDVLQLVAYGQLQTDAVPANTRAITSENHGNYELYEGANSIGVFLTYQTKNAPKEVSTFTYDATDGWMSQVKVKVEDNPYRIYGFMPTTFESAQDFKYQIAPLSTGETYNNGAILTFTNLPPVAKEDFCLLTGVQDLGGVKTATLNLKRGVFSYQGRAKGQNYANLMFEHLYGGVLFHLKIAEAYNQLRTIKLKEFKLLTTNIYTIADMVIKVNPTDDEATPFSVTSYTMTSSEGSGATLFTSEEGEELKTDTPCDISGYFFPLLSSTNNIGHELAMECTYDVYDKKGNLVRKSCVARNSLPDMESTPGTRNILTLTVEPTYLYVLSEPDLDNPTITISN